MAPERPGSPFEARPKALFEGRNLARRAIAAEHDLLLRVVERVERVEKFGLGPLFASQKLQIHPEQVQVFTPTPSTYSSLMYYTGLDPFSRQPLFVEKDILIAIKKI